MSDDQQIFCDKVNELIQFIIHYLHIYIMAILCFHISHIQQPQYFANFKQLPLKLLIDCSCLTIAIISCQLLMKNFVKVLTPHLKV